MKVLKYPFLLTGLLIMLIACNDSNDEASVRDNHSIDQYPAKNTEQLLKDHKEVTKAHAVNSNDYLVAAFDVKQRHKWNLEKRKKQYKKQLKKEFPNHTILLSTDQKLIHELNKLNNQLNKGELSKNEIKHHIKRLKTLHDKKT
ncbi:MAG TPA: YhcN/YlaJ family sporulation lipoprotein [Candidatus Avamphibacillus intestinigallinarum]|nr:YhcN/YlaJ family sporulation lipoprotein [Candidatus Avamphibacillus intestinigallinarum]